METLGNITSGGFGKVERVKLPSGVIVARKTFAPSPEVISASSIEKLRKRFEREVKIQSSLPREFFMPVLDSDLKSDPPYFTMPLADLNFEGEIIEKRIQHQIPVQGLTDLMNALETLHSLGYTHRDVKPQNLLLHENVWKLADFGLVTPGANITAVTSANSGWGSARYQAPEQYSGFKAVMPQADIYSFGCLLHDVFGSGVRVPYERQTCPGPIGTIIEKCTEKDPRKRFKSVIALRGALMTILANPIQIQASPDAAEWVQKLSNVSEWTDDIVSDYVHFLNNANSDDIAAIFEKIDEEWLVKAHACDPDLWHNSVIKYTEWARGGFPFDYCDVLVRRLEKIFELGTFDCAAAAVIAAAELGTSHNRWFVMKRCSVENIIVHAASPNGGGCRPAP